MQQNYRVYFIEPNEIQARKAIGLGALELENKSNEEQQAFLEANDIDTIFECAGAASSASLACAIAGRGSEIILLGLSEKPASFQPLKITRENISIKGSIIYDHPKDFKEVISLIERNILSPGFIVTDHYPLDALQEALTKAAAGHAGKMIIDIASPNE
jgi:threonine dehydrogenase-like Zn-dependent dehydrogenase